MKANNDLLDVVYYIKNNEDWNKLKEYERIVDINNDAYFGFRAMEKKAISIKYDPSIIDSLVRVVKESKKFPETKHILVLDQETLGYEARNGLENYLKAATRTIQEVLSINPELKLGFNIVKDGNDQAEAINILWDIYKNNI